MKEKRTAYCNTDQSVFSYGYEHIINCFKRKGSWHGVKGKVVNSSPFILAGCQWGEGGLYGKGCDTIHRIFEYNPTKSNL